MRENGKVTQEEAARFTAPAESYYDPRVHGSHISIDPATHDRIQILTGFNGQIVERRFPAKSPQKQEDGTQGTIVNGQENGHHALEGEFILTQEVSASPNGNRHHKENITHAYPPKFDAQRYEAYMEGPGGEASRQRAKVYKEMLKTRSGK